MKRAATVGAQKPSRFLLVLACIGFVSTVSGRLVEPMLPAIAADFGITLARAALLSSAFSFPYAIMQLGLGPFADAFGKERLIGISLTVCTIGLFLSALAPSFGALLGARAITGAFAGGLVPMCLAVLGDRVGIDQRQVVIGRFVVATISGQVIGAGAAGTLVDLTGWRAVFVVTGGMMAAVLVVAAWFLRGTQSARVHISPGAVLATYRRVVTNRMSLLVYATGCLEGAFVLGVLPFVAGMLMEHGASGSFEAGIAIGAFALGGVSLGILVRRLLSIMRAWTMMKVGVVLIGVAFALTAYPVSWHVAVALFYIAGFGFFMVHNTMQTRATELAPSARASAVAFFAGSFFIGQAIGPLVGALVLHAVGFRGLFIGAGVLMAVLGLLIATVMERGDSPHAKPT
jgi:MFS transporter, DHA1 family, inner membrane transport protein